MISHKNAYDWIGITINYILKYIQIEIDYLKL